MQNGFTLISFIAIFLLGVFFVFTRIRARNGRPLSNTVSIAVVLLLLGLMNFSENRLLGNILIGASAVLSALAVFNNFRKKNE